MRYPDRTAVPDSGDPLPLEKARQQRRPQRTADMMVPLGPIQTTAREMAPVGLTAVRINTGLG